jgi:hypothetical protein
MAQLFRLIMHARKKNPHVEYRLLQNQRINDSSSLAQKFPRLKTLGVDLNYFDSTGLTRNGGMSYKFNLEHAKSLFYFNCPNRECVGGDFDLTEALVGAVAGKLKTVTGEARCGGVRHNRERKERVPCQNVLRYTLRLGY